MAKNIQWFKVANSIEDIEWQDNNMATVETGGKKISLAKVGKDLFACSYKCPHAGGILPEGFLDGRGSVICPIHGFRFNLRNGYNVSGEGYFLKVFPIEEREAGLFVGFEETNVFDVSD
jgi:nitrite reductase/ring-hydroxylating ferredoxin subunit